jgi:hypothetical protein
MRMRMVESDGEKVAGMTSLATCDMQFSLVEVLRKRLNLAQESALIGSPNSFGGCGEGAHPEITRWPTRREMSMCLWNRGFFGP